MPRMPCGAAGVSGDGADTHRCRPGTGRPVLAVVLAAGRGTRMAPLTSELPKGLLPTLDAPHLSWVLASVARAGLRRVWVNAHDHHDLVAQVAAEQSGQRGMTVTVSHERQAPLGTAGALRALAAELTEPFLVANADVTTDLALGRLIEAHASARPPPTGLAIPVRDAAGLTLESRWGVD